MAESDFEPLDLFDISFRWHPLIRVFEYIIQTTRAGEEFDVHIARWESEHKWYRSPFIDIRLTDDDNIHVEMAGNATCDPRINDQEDRLMLILGWNAPGVTVEQFLDENGFGGVPNYWRDFDANYSAALIAELIVVSLLRCYKATMYDYFAFSIYEEQVDQIRELDLLQLAEFENKKGNKVIFKLKDGWQTDHENEEWNFEID